MFATDACKASLQTLHLFLKKMIAILFRKAILHQAEKSIQMLKRLNVYMEDINNELEHRLHYKKKSPSLT